MRRGITVGLTAALLVGALIGTGGGLAAARSGKPTRCTIPTLVGLKLSQAIRQAKRHGCRLLVHGQGRASAIDYQVVRQTHRLHGGRQRVTVWVKPAWMCFGSAAPGPPAGEPIVTTGTTGLVSGLFVRGGPAVPYPGCVVPQGVPQAGTIVVLRAGTAAVVTTRTVAEGVLAHIPLAPGRYDLRSTFAHATADAVPITATATVTITAGHTVRQDVATDVP
jgi:hypothetical protein